MEYILIIIGLVLIYLSLRFEIKKDNNGFKNVLSKSIENNEFDELKKALEYIPARLDNIENEITLLDSKVNLLEDEFKKINNAIKSFNNKEEAITNSETEKNNDIEKTNLTIYKLYDSGKSIEEISSILRIGKGEVSLRLGLRK